MTASRRNLKLAIASTTLAAITPLVVMPAIVDVTAGAQETASPIIDFTKQGSITLQTSTGGTLPTAEAYKLYKVKAYASAADIPATLPSASEALAGTKTMVGTAAATSWTGLDLGLYVLEAPAGHTSFVVSLPSTNQTNLNSFDYDLTIKVKPKNESTTKTVVDANGAELTASNPAYANAGDDISYLITSAIPANPYGTYTADTTWLKSYTITDNNINDDNLAYKSVKVAVGTAASSATALTVTGDYTYDTATKTVTLTTTGLIKLAAAKAAESSDTVKVFTTFTATVNTVATTDGTVSNTANVQWQLATKQTDNPGEDPGEGEPTDNPSNPGDNDDDPTTPDTTTPVVTKWVKIRGTKVDDSATPVNLSGAEFAVYKCTINNNVVDLSTITDANKLLTSTASDANGEFVVDGINTGYGKVCLVETKAPKGYELSSTPIIVDLATAATTSNSTVDPDGANMKVSITLPDKVVNVKSKFPTLPLTGGKGIALFAVLAALIAAGTVVATRKAANK